MPAVATMPDNWPAFLDPCPAMTSRGTISGPRIYRGVRVHMWQEQQFRAWWKANGGAMILAGWKQIEANGKTYLEQWLMPDGALTPQTLQTIAALRERAKPAQQTLALSEPEIVLDPLPDDLESKLLERQVIPARQLFRALRKGREEWGYPGAVDFSDMGAGKTYMDLAAALATGRKVCVLCPVVGQHGWAKAFAHYGAEPHFIGTYEGLRSGNRDHIVRKNRAGEYEWQHASEIVLILDEAQALRHDDTLNVRLCAAAIRQQIPIIVASATIAISPLEFRFAGRIVGLHNGGTDWERFLMSHGCRQTRTGGWEWCKDNRYLAKINARLFPRRGCRVRMEDLGDDAPETEIKLLPIDCGDVSASIASDYAATQDYIDRIGRDTVRGKIEASKARMAYWLRCELALVEPLAKLVKADHAAGRSVALFVGRVDTQRALWDALNCRGDGFYGGQALHRRNALMDAFQSDRIRTLVNQIGAGGASVSLHDVRGDYPRTAYIMPHDRPDYFRQAQGRVARTQAKSASLQWIPYAKGTVLHERMVKRCGVKMKAFDIINNGTADT